MNRKDWLHIIASSQKDELKALWEGSNINNIEAHWLRPPEFGLLPLQAKVNNTGDKFLFGDATITRSVVEVAGKTGYAFILGRDKEAAKCASIIDALMQGDIYADKIKADVLLPLVQKTKQREDAQAKEIAKTKVDFFTMVRGE